MMPLYLYLLVGSIIVPLVYTVFFVDPIKHWKFFFISTSIMAIIFLIWDVIFTKQGIWGFNHDYCAGLFILDMPIEEWLFFFVIPFCSLFIHFALKHAMPNLVLNTKLTRFISIAAIVLTLIVLLANTSKAYTATNAFFLLLVLTLGLTFYQKILQRFFISFLIILIPFFVVNGILTGALTPTPVVSYDNMENLGIRLVTIPIEDFGYAFTMLFGNLMIFEALNKKQSKV